MTDVSEGCICHVSLRVEAGLVRSSHNGEMYRLLEKAARTGAAEDFQAEEREHDKIAGARTLLMKVVDIGIRTLLSMDKLDQLVAADDSLELRLLLCRVPKLHPQVQADANSPAA